MMTRTFTAEEIRQLRFLNKTHPHPAVRHRALIVILKSQNTAHGKIAQMLDISENTVRKYLRLYVDHGIEGLKKNKLLSAPKSSGWIPRLYQTLFRKHSSKQCSQGVQRDLYTDWRRGKNYANARVHEKHWAWVPESGQHSGQGRR